MKRRKQYTCPLELTHDVTKGKWKPIILWLLGKGVPMQPTELAKAIQDINQKMLLEQLGELAGAGMVHKKVYEGYPLKTEYALTPRGEKMLEAIVIMQSVGLELMAEAGEDCSSTQKSV